MHRAPQRRRSSLGTAALCFVTFGMVGMTLFNLWVVFGSHGSHAAASGAPDHRGGAGHPTPAATHGGGHHHAGSHHHGGGAVEVTGQAHHTEQPTAHDVESLMRTVVPAPTDEPAAGDTSASSSGGSHPAANDHEHELEYATDPPDPQLSKLSYDEALAQYERYLHQHLNVSTDQDTKSFIDVPDAGGHGVGVPHDTARERTRQWLACDPGNTTFSLARDFACGKYLSELNNVRSVKAMPSRLLNGRTLKFKLFYHHGNLSAIVKVSQKKFFFEAVSEYLSYHVDRALGLSRVPPTVFFPLPVDFMRAAAAGVSPFYVQWFDKFVPKYDLTKGNFMEIDGRESALIAAQVWMHDVHSALMGYLAVNYEQDDYFLHKFYDPADPHRWPPRPHRLTAIGDLCDRFIFDFIIGNTDRGMNDHNNFVYGGCDRRTACKEPEPWRRTKGDAKYAFIDHGSSFYSHREPEGSPFTGNATTKYIICRFRRSTYDRLKRFVRSEADVHAHRRPLVDAVLGRLPREYHYFNVVRKSVFKVTQDRLEKVVRLADECVKKHGEGKVFVL